MSLDIRPAAIDEAARLAELDAAADAYPWSSAQYSSAVAGRGGQRVLVACVQSEVVACAVIAVLAGQGSIYRIVVGSEQRRRGFARALLRAALSTVRAEGAEKCVLEVRESNIPALALYEQTGFSLDGRRKGYYTQPAHPGGREDALLMSHSLED